MSAESWFTLSLRSCPHLLALCPLSSAVSQHHFTGLLVTSFQVPGVLSAWLWHPQGDLQTHTPYPTLSLFHNPKTTLSSPQSPGTVSVWQSSLQTSLLARLTLQMIKAVLDLIALGSLSWISNVNPRSSKEKKTASLRERKRKYDWLIQQWEARKQDPTPTFPWNWMPTTARCMQEAHSNCRRAPPPLAWGHLSRIHSQEYLNSPAHRAWSL